MREGIFKMKDKTVGYGLYIAMGMAIVGIAALILYPIIRGILNDSDKHKPTFQTTAIETKANPLVVSTVHYELPAA